MNTAIIIENLSITLSIGLLNHERERPQRVMVSLKLFTDVSYLKEPDTLIDYGLITQQLQALERSPHIDLVETLTLNILDIAFQYNAVTEVFLKVTKPDIIAEADHVGIETTIMRDGYENGLKSR